MRHRMALLLMLVCSAALAEGPVHKCVNGKKVVFSDKPCKAGQSEAAINAAMTAYSGSESSRRNVDFLKSNPSAPAQPSPNGNYAPPPPAVQRATLRHY